MEIYGCGFLDFFSQKPSNWRKFSWKGNKSSNPLPGYQSAQWWIQTFLPPTPIIIQVPVYGSNSATPLLTILLKHDYLPSFEPKIAESVSQYSETKVLDLYTSKPFHLIILTRRNLQQFHNFSNISKLVDISNIIIIKNYSGSF